KVENLQLLGISSLFIASKFFEKNLPSIKSFEFQTENFCKISKIKKFEFRILNILNFNLFNFPTSFYFLSRLLNDFLSTFSSNPAISSLKEKLIFLSHYLIESTLLNNKLIGQLPSNLAIASFYLALKILNIDFLLTSKSFNFNTNLFNIQNKINNSNFIQIKSIILEIFNYLINKIIHKEFFKKYASSFFLKVSIIARFWSKDLVLKK
ncbi:uncharacterized protein ASCRUDRAFT_24363, partial [Ascoidea rubescens DSM 1968]